MKLPINYRASIVAILLAGCLSVVPKISQAQSGDVNIPKDYDHTALPDVKSIKDDPSYKSEITNDQARKEYADKIRENYNYRFGKGDISTPGNAKVVGDDFIQPGAFPAAKYCAKCHAEAYGQWRHALHSNSFRTPFYRTSVNILLRTKGIEFTRHCDSCHNPIGVLTGGLTQNAKVDRKFDEEGLTCTTCHSIQKLQSTSGNGGFTMGVPSVMVDENGNRIPGTVPYAEIFAHRDRHSKAVMKDFLRTPEFCAACHKANLPNPLNDYKFVRAFTVYDEWQNSKFSQRNPLTFYSGDFTTCQGCHMKRAPVSNVEFGAKDGTFASHRWPAGNTAVPFYYHFDDQMEKTLEFLKSGNYLNVDLFAIEKKDTGKMVAPLGLVSFDLKPKETVQAMVVIQNKNIGHSLIPEVRDLYEAWVEFAVKDGSGNDIYHSGFLKPDLMIDERAHSFTNRPVTTEGEFVDNHKVWTIHSVAYDNTVPAGRSVLVRYEFPVPENAKGPLTVTAKVNYRHLRQSYLNNIFGKDDHPAYPVVELASRTRTLNLGDNPAVEPDPQDNAEWMRWNNFGIACLDQFQYAEAVNAFSEVIKLRPEYVDGYINVGLTNILWEKYGSARMDLEKALALKPDNARALYYMALVERRENHSDIAVINLLKVIAQYPQSRDARRELGVTYYQQHKLEEAKVQFETLQGIDPDDVAAHYNLSILYNRLGMKEKAAEQAALFTTKKIDPNAPTYSLDFLTRHPEIRTESVPWHMHTNSTGDSVNAEADSASPKKEKPAPDPAYDHPATSKDVAPAKTQASGTGGKR